MCPEKVTLLIKALEHKPFEEMAEGAGVLSLERKRLGEDLSALCNYLKEGCRDMGSVSSTK